MLLTVSMLFLACGLGALALEAVGIAMTLFALAALLINAL